jgi:hypothetical protein
MPQPCREDVQRVLVEQDSIASVAPSDGSRYADTDDNELWFLTPMPRHELER